MFKMEAVCGCFLGNGRSHNEDNFYFDKKHLPQENQGLKQPIQFQTTTREPVLLAVFDGMGGEKRGEEAACRACEVFAEEVKQLDELVIPGKELLYRACHKANQEVVKIATTNQCGTMGTTVAALYFFGDEVCACNVGDSKIFRIRNKQMVQISKDHTDEKIMSAMGINKKPVLLQYIGVPDTEMAIDPFVSKGEISSGDIYIICSDGITDVLSANEIYQIVEKGDSLEEVVRKIVGKVDSLNGSDNATIIMVKLTGQRRES